MKKKQFLFLFTVCLVLGLVWFWQNSARTSDWSGGEKQVGLLPQGIDLDSVSAIRLMKDQQVLTLVKNEQGWGLQERFGYPLDLSNLKTLFVDLLETNAVQQLTLDSAQAEELSLIPGKGAVVMTLLGQNEKELAPPLIFGKKHERESEIPQMAFYGGGNIPLGRYMDLQGRYFLVPNTFSRVDDPILQWLDQEFFKISDMKQAVLKDGETILWEVSRNSASDELALAGTVPEGMEIDSAKLASLKNAFSWIRFSDIGDPNASPDSLGFHQARSLRIEGFDGTVYNLTVSAPVDGKHYLKIAISWQGETQRKAVAEETLEDKANADRTFAVQVREKQEKARDLNLRLSPWIYQVEQRSLENAVFDRDAFFKKKAESEK